MGDVERGGDAKTIVLNVPGNDIASSIESKADDVTTNFTSSEKLAESSSPSDFKGGFDAGVVAESKRPRFDDETRKLLHSRLSWAALDLLFVLGLGYIGNFFAINSPWLAFRTFILFIIIGSYVLLRTQNVLSIRILRQIEMSLFGGVAIQVGLMMYSRMVFFTFEKDATSLAGTQDFYITAFCLHVLTYGTFVPNSWRRAALVNTALALVPYGVWYAITITHPECIELFTKNRAAAPIPLTLMAAMVGTLGSHIIYTTRREAFQAKQIMQYRLHSVIGSGGMGDVYRAEHVLLKRSCAIKLIKPDRAVNDMTLHRFEREVVATAKLSHWNTIDIYDYGHTSDGTFYYVMELLEGENLQRLIERYGVMPSERIIYILSQVCDALQEAHDSGLIHRDIKPANIFITHRGGYWDVVKLLDFGLVKETVTTTQTTGDIKNTSKSSQRMNFSGTPMFMAPEQATRYEDVDCRSDIYALGCVAYFLATGTPPFSNSKVMDLIIAHATTPPQPPSERNSLVSDELEGLILRCLAKDPDDRFQSASELYEALSKCSVVNPWTAGKAKEWWKTRSGSRHPASPDPV